ncbi:MAG: hypothetical protein KC649_06210, partial [Candidatus Omnitrophica bacterium]|nr:hypothetical protein [Candidatus Omnitrophota bacterium]
MQISAFYFEGRELSRVAEFLHVDGTVKKLSEGVFAGFEKRVDERGVEVIEAVVAVQVFDADGNIAYTRMENYDPIGNLTRQVLPTEGGKIVVSTEDGKITDLDDIKDLQAIRLTVNRVTVEGSSIEVRVRFKDGSEEGRNAWFVGDGFSRQISRGDFREYDSEGQAIVDISVLSADGREVLKKTEFYNTVGQLVRQSVENDLGKAQTDLLYEYGFLKNNRSFRIEGTDKIPMNEGAEIRYEDGLLVVSMNIFEPGSDGRSIMYSKVRFYDRVGNLVREEIKGDDKLIINVNTYQNGRLMRSTSHEGADTNSAFSEIEYKVNPDTGVYEGFTVKRNGVVFEEGTVTERLPDGTDKYSVTVYFRNNDPKPGEKTVITSQAFDVRSASGELISRMINGRMSLVTPSWLALSNFEEPNNVYTGTTLVETNGGFTFNGDDSTTTHASRRAMGGEELKQDTRDYRGMLLSSTQKKYRTIFDASEQTQSGLLKPTVVDKKVNDEWRAYRVARFEPHWTGWEFKENETDPAALTEEYGEGTVLIVEETIRTNEKGEPVNEAGEVVDRSEAATDGREKIITIRTFSGVILKKIKIIVNPNAGEKTVAGTP